MSPLCGPQEDTVEHTVAVCPAWAEHRRVLREAIGGGGLSRPALAEATVRGARRHGKPSPPSAKQYLMLAKQVASRERHPTSVSQPEVRVRVGAREDARADARGATPGSNLVVSAMISGHRRRGLADGEQRVALSRD